MPIGISRITFLLLCFGALIFLVASLFWGTIHVYTYKEPQLQIETIDTSDVSAVSFIVFDAATGMYLSSKNPDTVMPIASITKLMVASQVYKKENLGATTSIEWGDVAGEGRAGKLQFSDEYSSYDLLYPLLLESSNDAALALARTHRGLLSSMNEFTTELGLSKTHFEDTSGLSDKNVSTAGELAIFTRALFAQQPHIFDITRLSQFIGVHTGWINNNPLVAEKGYRGGKHGFTTAANRTMVAFFDESLLSGQTLTVGYVVLGSDSIKKDIAQLRKQIQQNVRFE